MDERQIIITPVLIDDVLKNDKISINTNNCTIIPPTNYHEVLNAGNTQFWINKFHGSSYRTLILDNEDIEWMKDALAIGAITGNFSNLFSDSLRWTLEKNKEGEEWISKGEWFIRLEEISLKTGMYGTGPYNSLEKIIKSIVTSNRTYRCLENKSMITIYFLPFIKGLDYMKEFRVFVFQGEITAISQQSLYSENSWLTYLYKKNMLEEFVREKILIPFKQLIKPKMEDYLTNYVMDYALIESEDENESVGFKSLRPYFIEPNSWGADYAAGSALFGWLQDYNKLYDNKDVEFRFVLSKKPKQ